MKAPLITTIIPTYKRPFLLRRAIISVLNQSFKDLQVCVYDNASGDETKKIVEELALKDNRVKYFCHKENIGGPDNFRYGLEQNKSEYFSFLSDDDLLFPDFYELAIRNLQKYPEAGFFVGKCFIASLDSKNIKSPGFCIEREGYYTIDEAINTFVGKEFAPWTSILFNYSHVKSFELSSLVINDVDYVAKIMYNFPIIVSSQACSVFFVHENGISSNLKIKDIWPVMDKLEKELKCYKRVASEIHAEVSSRIRNNVINFIFQKGKESIRNDDQEMFIEATKILQELDSFHLVKKLKFFFKIKKVLFLWQSLLFLRQLYLNLFKKKYNYEKMKVMQLLESIEKNLNLR